MSQMEKEQVTLGLVAWDEERERGGGGCKK